MWTANNTFHVSCFLFSQSIYFYWQFIHWLNGKKNVTLIWNKVYHWSVSHKYNRRNSDFFFFFQTKVRRYSMWIVCLAYITKTYLYNSDPHKPHFYIVKLEFTGGIHCFSYFCSNTLILGTLWNHLDKAVLTSTHNLCFEQKCEKCQLFYLKTFCFCRWNLIYLNRRVFTMKVGLKVLLSCICCVSGNWNK